MTVVPGYKENDISQMIQTVWNKIPFNQVLGLELVSLDRGDIRIRMKMKDELVGNYIQRILHGGVISSILDVAGGLVSSLEALWESEGRPIEEIEHQNQRFSTLDLRVDFLKPGRGNQFLAKGELLRMGKNTALAKMELKNDDGILIAVGTGTYYLGDENV
jgi:uncharacterized protein (TIGR00369 family)